MLTIAVSPYHLTSRELPAMASLLVADTVITALPVPRAGVSRNTIRAAFRHAPRYLRLIESWRWGTELWREGTIVSEDRRDVEGEADAEHRRDAMVDFARSLQDVHTTEVYAPLREFIDRHLLANEYESLDRICADILKGGPDPGICVPMAAGLDVFAAQRGAVVARLGREMAVRRSGPSGQSQGSTGSLTQRAEELFGQTLFSVAIPVLMAAGGEVLAEARVLLEPELESLRAALSAAFIDGADRTRCEKQVRLAAAEFGVAFERHRVDVVDVDDEWGERVTATTVKVVGRRLPIDAALRSSIAALRTAQHVGLVTGLPPIDENAVAAEPSRETVNTLVVSQLVMS